MKRAILLILLLPILASAQYFDVFDIDTSDYPMMKAKFYSIDANGNQILNHTPADFEITENGEPRDVISVSCPDPLPRPISVGIMVDTYSYIEIARNGSETLVKYLNMPLNEVSITYMDRRPLVYQDFTNDKTKALKKSKTIPPAPGYTQVERMFFDSYAGGINLIKTREAQNRVLVYISDLHCPNLSLNEQKLFQEAIDNNIRIYTVLINTVDYTGLFKRISDKTNGVLFENVRNGSEIEDIFKKIAYIEQNDPCEISWNSNVNCKDRINLNIFNKTNSLFASYNYRIAKDQIVNLELDTYFVNFGFHTKGSTKDTSITITPRNIDLKINNITFEPNLGYFELLDTLPISIQKDQSLNLTIRYNAIDTSKLYSKLTLATDYCDFYLGLLAGGKYSPISLKTLELTHPNGGEVFNAGADTIITWEGISINDKVRLNFSNDNGKNWKTITYAVSGNNKKWRIPTIESDSCIVSVNQFDNNSTPNGLEIEWEKSYGGSYNDQAYSITETTDGGFIAAGRSVSTDGDITNPRQSYDFWIVKLNSIGELEWQKSYGGSDNDIPNKVIQTNDGGFVVAGITFSDDGDVSNPKGSGDSWIIKLNSVGELEWEKSYGGSKKDEAKSIVQSIDGGYVIAGVSDSDDGDITNPKGNDDYWIVKLNSIGELEWEKSYGGSDEELANSIQQTFDGGYIIAGQSKSQDEDITNPKGNYDYWIIKLNSVGELEWEKSYGGTDFDGAYSIEQTNEGGFIVAGNSNSQDGDISTPKGNSDYWIVKLNSIGKIEWQKSYGGTDLDGAYSIQQTDDEGFIIVGFSYSTDGDITNHKGNYDYWIMKLPPPPPPLQSDISDAVFSIIIPKPVIQNNDIDMGQMIVGSTKDTIVSSVICNVGDAPLHVLGVDITGGDAGDFLIPRGAGDLYLNKGECQDMMFEFTPSALGNRTAVATIRTTVGDFKDTIHIRGVGINPIIEATANVVDFGVFELGNGKDTTVVLVKNVGSTDITITDTRISGPDMEQFKLKISPVNYTIAAGEEKEFKLNYTAKYGGKTNSFLDFHYDGIGSPIRSLLFAEGIGGEVYPVVADAYVGENVNLNILLGKIKPEGLREVATNFTATVSYNSSLLAPIDKSMLVTTEDNKSYIKINGNLSGVSQIAAIPMKVGLGTADRSGLVITEFQLYNANGDSVDYDIEPGVGEFNVLGICEEGGKRLINPNGEEVAMQVIPEINSGNARVQLTLIETGRTELEIYDQIGNKIETIYSGTPSAGSQEINLDLSNYANGRYYIRLTTPTITKTEIIEVVR